MRHGNSEDGGRQPVTDLRGTALVTGCWRIWRAARLTWRPAPPARGAPGLDPAEPVSLNDRLEIIEHTPLRAERGAQWHYSSPGFLLAGTAGGAAQPVWVTLLRPRGLSGSRPSRRASASVSS